MYEDLRVLEGREKIPAHAVGDDSILQPKNVQRRDLERGVVKLLVLLTKAAEGGNKDGKAEVEFRLHFLLLERAQHGNKSCSLTESQDAVKRALVLHGFSHSRYAVIEAQARLTLLLSAEAPGLNVRKPPSSGLFIALLCRN